MQVLVIDREQPDPEVIRTAAVALRDGRLVAFPTETVYGLGANALDPDAVKRIFEAKGRPAYNPLIVHVESVEAAVELVAEWPELASRLAERFWPGALTLVLRKKPVVPDIVTAGLDTVAIRIPSHPVALALVRAAGVPVAAPSANRFTELSPTVAAHVVKSLPSGHVAFLLDAGSANVGIESTVLDVTGARPVLLRPGGVSTSDIADVLGEYPAMPEDPGATLARPSPGMVPRHYAPRARLIILGLDELTSGRPVDTRGFTGTSAAGRLTGSASAAPERIAALTISADDIPGAVTFHMPPTAAGYASELFRRLHACDDAGFTMVLVESVPPGVEWDGVRDRLKRASTL